MPVNQFLTLMDLKNSMEPGDAAIASVAEIIAQENEILDDIPFVHGNQVTGDISFIRATQPRPVKKKINQGIVATKSSKTPKQEVCVILNDRGIVDMDELKIAPSRDEYLLQENKAHIAGLGEGFAEMVLFDNDPEGITGLCYRYNKTSGPYKRQIIDAGGTGDALQSVYFTVWDSDEFTGLLPRNTKTAGLEVVPQENVYIPDKDGRQLLCHVTEFKWFVGLKIRDHRYGARLCNIASDITDEVLFEKFITAKNRLIKNRRRNAVAYLSPDLYNRFEVAAFRKTNANITYKEDIQNDTTIVSVAGIRLRENDCQLVENNPEKQVV